LPEASDESRTVPATGERAQVSSVDIQSISLASIGAPVAACTTSGLLVGATPSASALLERLPMPVAHLPQPIPTGFWRALTATPTGEAMLWSPSPEAEARLGCTRHTLGDHHFILLMREVSGKQRLLIQRLHRQRLEASGQLVAGIAHDVRNSLSAIVFNVEMLDECAHDSPDVRESIDQIRVAALSLRKTVDGLIDFARLGQSNNASVLLVDVYHRVVSLLRGTLRGSSHVLAPRLDPTTRVNANLITLEQVLVNLIMNALEANPTGTCVRISSEPHTDPLGRRFVKVRVVNDGEPLPPSVRAQLFEPFFTTKESGTGLGLAVSREALRELGGDLLYEPVDGNPGFSLVLPAPEGEGAAR
jgi:signal transduction histidine kinase